jgi:hypothetical protein
VNVLDFVLLDDRSWETLPVRSWVNHSERRDSRYPRITVAFVPVEQRRDVCTVTLQDRASADRPACATLAGQPRDAHKLMTILEHLLSCLPRTAPGEVPRLTSPMAAKTPRNKPSASGSLRNPLSGSRFRRCPSVDLGSIDCR